MMISEQTVEIINFLQIHRATGDEWNLMIVALKTRLTSPAWMWIKPDPSKSIARARHYWGLNYSGSGLWASKCCGSRLVLQVKVLTS
jgi:hypothetical protein